jgi:hypothetical protein
MKLPATNLPWQSPTRIGHQAAAMLLATSGAVWSPKTAEPPRALSAGLSSPAAGQTGNAPNDNLQSGHVCPEARA